MDLAVAEIHEQVKDFLKICKNASYNSVADVVIPELAKKFRPTRYEDRILKQELGRAYDRYSKES